MIAANFYGHPTGGFHLIGVTGTNGKTTTTYMVESILKAAGLPSAVFGTIEYRGPGFGYSAERTTPEAPDLESLFRRVLDAGWKYAVMEVSSHAIELKRVEQLAFRRRGVHESQPDHLDFHGDMRSYFLEKKKLLPGWTAPYPAFSSSIATIAQFEELSQIDPSRVISYGIENAADVRPLSHHFGWQGTEAVFGTPSWRDPSALWIDGKAKSLQHGCRNRGRHWPAVASQRQSLRGHRKLAERARADFSPLRPASLFESSWTMPTPMMRSKRF